MKANEFVRDLIIKLGVAEGLSEVKELLEFGIKPKKTWVGSRCITFKQQDLKRLVDSWDLVESFGGLDGAKRFLNENVPCLDSVRLEKAIADVESCQ